ncbi:MAG: fibronectin type III domain-containing protein [Deferribacteres bacterium]|nr:fibronectin type III domain-containing protein [candidate division KSB1 bacterium]MCB9501791.1 fibronectin type III domain-containing protein [Deferribacteres bacterium]
MKKRIEWIQYVFVAGLLLLFMLATGCIKKPSAPEELLQGNDTFPGKPFNIHIALGDGLVRLDWTVNNRDDVDHFLVTRQNVVETQTIEVSVIDTVFVDAGLINGQEYIYTIKAVKVINDREFSGLPSDKITARPNVYSILLENGADFTSSRAVTLGLTAPTTTSIVELSNSEDFANSSLLQFQSTLQWTLSPGDGPKVVWAKFQDQEGQTTNTAVSDSIFLDTRATIILVEENTNGQSKIAADSIYFSMYTGEPFGLLATISIEDGPRDVQLNDLGTGYYDAWYVIPKDADVLQATITGNFTDRAGNEAIPVIADSRVTILRAPAAVTLFKPVIAGDGRTSLKLSWSLTEDQHDFQTYEVYRSVLGSNEFTLVSIISISTETSYTDSGLSPNTTYVYKIVVRDRSGLTGESNEESQTTRPDEIANPVILYKPLYFSDATTNQIDLNWTTSAEDNFNSYQIYRSTSPNVTTNSTLIGIIPQLDITTYSDTHFFENSTYYYSIFVYDDRGQVASISNEVSVTVPNTLPEPVYLAQPIIVDSTRFQLSWSQSLDPDFANYRIYRSRGNTVNLTEEPIAILSGEVLQTTFEDLNLTPNVIYSYRVFVYDTNGDRAGSNTVTELTGGIN